MFGSRSRFLRCFLYVCFVSLNPLPWLIPNLWRLHTRSFSPSSLALHLYAINMALSSICCFVL